jgi:hydroxymethylpyrimidine/phosphomethylpyrimidine kinase
MRRVLTVAGSDSGGGAGIQADLKTITVLGAYGMSVITALTAQNTLGVQAVHEVPADFIRQQLDSVLSDIGADAAKTGMLANAEIVRTVAEGLRRHRVEPIVVDPVMVAKSGDPLLSPEARETLKEALLPLAFVVTPNLPEASVLSGIPVGGVEAMKEAAEEIHRLGPKYVLIKGGHLRDEAVDLLYDGRKFESFRAPRLQQRNTHGTGCTFSAALATLLAQGKGIMDAVSEAKEFITRAIASGLDMGAGHGPTNPYAHLERYILRDEVLRQLQDALERLLEIPMGELIPEVRSNLGYALPAAISHEEVAAIPGRISQVGDRLLAHQCPSFGASRHIASVILAAMSRFPELRSAMNIRYSPRALEACRSAGIQLSHFHRGEEPPSIKQREGSTLEWGTKEALKGLNTPPDGVCDEGDVGKEPMIRILGTDPNDVVEKVARIWRAYSS